MEPGQGYEEAGNKTIARLDGQNMVLDGTKTMVRLADRASFMITRVAIGSADDVRFMIVDMKSPGSMSSDGTDRIPRMSLCEVCLNSVVIGQASGWAVMPMRRRNKRNGNAS